MGALMTVFRIYCCPLTESLQERDVISQIDQVFCDVQSRPLLLCKNTRVVISPWSGMLAITQMVN